MPHSATIKYDRPLVRRAVNRFMVQRLRKVFVAIAILLVLALLYWYLTASWNWVLTSIAVTIAVVVTFFSWIYFVRLRAAEGFFDKADDPTVTIRFNADGVQTESDLGSSNIKWIVFEEVLKFPDVWLLVYAKSGYMTLPVDKLTPELMEFIDHQLQRNR
ncbi:MAG: YcxB family protein [Acidobacteriota bacterium]